jgi:hypothetical protein
MCCAYWRWLADASKYSHHRLGCATVRIKGARNTF